MCKILTAQYRASRDIHGWKRLGWRYEMPGVLASTYRPGKRANVTLGNDERADIDHHKYGLDIIYRTPHQRGLIEVTTDEFPGICVYDHKPDPYGKGGILVPVVIPRGTRVCDISQAKMPNGWAAERIVLNAYDPVYVSGDYHVDINAQEEQAMAASLLEDAGYQVELY